MAAGAQTGTPMTRRAAHARAIRLASMLLVAAILGEAGHVLFDQLNAEVAHHFFHLFFPVAAFAVFAGLVAVDIRTRGWPTFSWKLDQPVAAGRPPSRPRT